MAGLVLLIFISGIAFAQDAGGEASKAYMEAHKKMMTEMGMKHTGDADKDFVMMMIPHHQGAIDMAKIQLQYGKDPTLREMATQIIAAQEKEIAEMKQWQSEHASAQ
jgi:uncharacterized protein (DUF305 family)